MNMFNKPSDVKKHNSLMMNHPNIRPSNIPSSKPESIVTNKSSIKPVTNQGSNVSNPPGVIVNEEIKESDTPDVAITNISQVSYDGTLVSSQWNGSASSPLTMDILNSLHIGMVDIILACKQSFSLNNPSSIPDPCEIIFSGNFLKSFNNINPYQTWGYQSATCNIKAISSSVDPNSISIDNVSVGQFTASNETDVDKPGKYAGQQTQTNTVSTTWSLSSNVNFKVSAKISLEPLGIGGDVTTEFGFSTTVGMSGTSSKNQLIGTTSEMSFIVPPHSTIIAKLMMYRTQITINTDFSITPSGYFALNFPSTINGHYVWFLDAYDILSLVAKNKSWGSHAIFPLKCSMAAQFYTFSKMVISNGTSTLPSNNSN